MKKHMKNNARAILVVLALDDENSTLTIIAIFETVLPRGTHTDSYGALRLFEICNLVDAASFELTIAKRTFGKVPNAFYIVNTLFNNYFFSTELRNNFDLLSTHTNI